MEFLSTGNWWLFFVLGILFQFLQFFGHHGRGRQSPRIKVIGFVGQINFIILSFIFSGWKGGIAIFVALFLWAFISERLVWLIFRKHMSRANHLSFNQFINRSEHYHSSSKFPSSAQELLDQSTLKDEILNKISNRAEIVKALQKHGKKPKDINNIFWILMASGVGEYVAQSVIENPQLLSEYLQMQASGDMGDVEIAHKLTESLGRS